MKKNESWKQFMDRAKENGLSPTRQEEVDREEAEDKTVKIILEPGVSYVSRNIFEHYGEEILKKISGASEIRVID